jgi:acetylornithine deacetylase/succinyl-diaminopimelate desuccinylase-like protein
VLLGFGQPDENAHAPDEFISLSHLYGGIRTSVFFFQELPRFLEGGKR